MLFNSLGYILLFLPLAVLIYFGLNRAHLTVAAKAWLVLASLFFYGYWNPAYLLLILTSIAVNFTLAEAIQKSIARRYSLWLGLVFNLGLLGYFKYANFFIDNVNWLIDGAIEPLDLMLPLAISFFTFQQIAYLVDSYKGLVKERNFLNYCLFVTYFPQLIAGPIVHHSEMMPQFASSRLKLIRWNNMFIGLFIFSMGLFKKVVIADTLAVWANNGFDGTESLDFWTAWQTSLSYTFQLYYDFSGYTDMAIGAALMMNIRLPINFNSPYKACDIQDFWRRWHMTLSRWLRDYLYIPLGGNRGAEWRTDSNLFITFLLGGLWHGAGWTFVIWGALHGGAVIVHRYWKKARLRLPSLLGWLVTFLYVNMAWVFFRAASTEDALRVLKGMANIHQALPQTISSALKELLNKLGHVFDSSDHWLATKKLVSFEWNDLLNGSMPALEYTTTIGLIAVAAMTLLMPNSMQWATSKNNKPLGAGHTIMTAILMTVPLFLLAFMSSRVSEFIYFNF